MVINKPMPTRSRFEGVKRVIQFNWHLYVLGVLISAGLLAMSAGSSTSPLLKLLCLSGSMLILVQMATSLFASHLVYDLSELNTWTWLRKISSAPKTVVTVTAGYDETCGRLVEVFPDAEILTINFYDDLERKEPSIQIAARMFPAAGHQISNKIDSWPVEKSSIDLIFMAFAAHEVRDPDNRDKLFGQAAQALHQTGSLVLVEHLRDASNFLAYGPGFFHFLPKSEWLRCTNASGLKVVNYFKITPFVGVFVLCR
jgi:hypothetical protein